MAFNLQRGSCKSRIGEWIEWESAIVTIPAITVLWWCTWGKDSIVYAILPINTRTSTKLSRWIGSTKIRVDVFTLQCVKALTRRWTWRWERWTWRWEGTRAWAWGWAAERRATERRATAWERWTWRWSQDKLNFYFWDPIIETGIIRSDPDFQICKLRCCLCDAVGFSISCKTASSSNRALTIRACAIRV